MKSLETQLIEILSSVIEIDPDRIFRDRLFSEQSIGSAQLRRFADELERRFQTEIPNLLLECHSIRALQHYLSRAVRKAEAGLVESSDPFADLGFVEGLPDVMFYE